MPPPPDRSFPVICRHMTYKQFNKFCRALPATTYVVQWGGAHVWKVGGKVFAIGGWQDDEASFTFKVSDIAYEMLKEQPGLRPAPYLASRGMKWIQRSMDGEHFAAMLEKAIARSHAPLKQIELKANDGPVLEPRPRAIHGRSGE